MLTIRMQRTGRTGHAQFRVVAQDKRFSPNSGRVTAYLGSYDPHTKAAQLDSQKIASYLEKGAQPSPRVIRLLKAEGIKLPKWAVEPSAKKKTIRNPEKLRKNRPADAEPKAEAKPATASADEAPAEPAEDKPAETADPTDEAQAEEAMPSEPAPEPKAEEAKTEEPKPEETKAEASTEATDEDQSAEKT